MSGEQDQVPLIKKFLVAVRPFAYTASVTSVLLGVALASYAGHRINWGLFIVTLVGVVLFHTAANLLNDCFDHRRGLDKAVLPMSGAVVRGWFTEKQVFNAAMIILGLGMACGFFLVYKAGWVVLALGVAGTILALGYTRSGFCFKYTGLGDIAIFLSFGVLPVFGTYWVQTQSFSWVPVLWSIPLSSFTVGILHANNWHDIETDPAMGCVTPASRLGERGSAIYYRFLMIGPFVLSGAYLVAGLISPVSGFAPFTVPVVMLAMPPAIKLTRINRENNKEVFEMLDGKTAQVQLMFGLLLPSAFIAERFLLGAQG